MNALDVLLKQEIIDDPEKWFESVCQILFYKTVFHIKDRRYKITEAELYLKTDDHPDVFIHGSKEQTEPGLFYFHKQGRGGIDITFGNTNRFGGILLRGMQSIDDKSYIDGPVLLYRRIIKNLGREKDKVKKVVPDLNIEIFNKNDLWLEETSGNDQVIYKAPRVGLTLLKDVEDRLPYFAKLYRYLASPRKTKNGKGLLSVALKNQGYDPVSLLGRRKTTLDKHMALFREGVDLQSSYKNNELFHIRVFGELSRNNVCVVAQDHI